MTDAWLNWLNENVRDEYRVFVGPCEHGRDPYTRCDVCGSLPPEEAKARSERAAKETK